MNKRLYESSMKLTLVIWGQGEHSNNVTLGCSTRLLLH